MSITLTAKLRLSRPGVYKHWCSGCVEAHLIEVDFLRGEDAHDPIRKFNGSIHLPTFYPSVMFTTIDGSNSRKICSYYVTAGRIEYLPETTHHLSGLTVELPDFPAYRIS